MFVDYPLYRWRPLWSPTAYTCPVALRLAALMLGRKWYWSPGRPGECGVWKVYHAPRIPRWLALAECRFWNSCIGVRLRERHAK